ncbi:histidine phosphatase family protein [Mycolicibacterium sp. XJ647]
MEVALIRHGLPNRIEGVHKPDPGLTGDGFEQARAVADALALLPVHTIASSGLQRALQTAGPTAERLGLTVNVEDDLAEFDMGEDYYIPIEDMIVENDPRLDRWREAVVDPSMADVFAEFRQRVTVAVDRVADATRTGMAAVFCHGGVIAACIEKALGGMRLPTAETEYGSISRVTISANGEWKLRSLNEIHHLERYRAQREERNELSR